MTFYVISARNRMTTITVFSFDGADFIRVRTTLLTDDGKSALNTKLDHGNPGYQALMQQRSYRGEMTLFGRHHDTHYAPLANDQGALDGAIFVGFQR